MNIDRYDWFVYLGAAAVLAFNNARWWECILVPFLIAGAIHWLREVLR